MTIFNYFQIIQQRRLTFYRISYECNSSSPMTFVEIRLYAIVILLQYLLIMFVACSTFFSRTASNKVNIRLTKRIFHFSVEDLVNYSKNMKLWIYENHICELRSEELNEGWSSQLYTQLLQLRKESLKKIQACTGFEPLTSAIPVQRSTN